MRYAIYGVNRVAKDFMYIFESINIVCFFEDESVEKSWIDIPVYRTSNIQDMNKLYDQIIICDFEKKTKKERLEHIGLKYGKDFVYEEDFFSSLDNYILNPSQKKIVVWGAGRRAEKMNAFFGINEIEFFVDSKVQGDYWKNSGKRILQPQQVGNWKDYFIVVTTAKSDSIISFLCEHGMKEYEDYCSLYELLTQPSWMLRKTIFDRSCYNVECQTIFNHIELNQSGELMCCCVPFVIGRIGSIENGSIKSSWMGIVHKIMCLAINNRTYSFCNSNMCPVFIGREKNTEFSLERQYLEMEKYPRNLLVNFEDSCNLKCESCRNEVKIAEGKEHEKNMRYADILINEVLPYVDFITMAGTGEVFVGKAYKKMFTSNAMDNIKWIRLLTNGTLFNEQNWKKFSSNKNGKIILTVSVDAATKETYEKLRRNGKFDILKRNMEFASSLRKEGRLSYFRMNFVVQRKNYLEMPLFVEWGKELGVDEVFFTKILNYGTYSQDEFSEISMMEPDEMTPKKELIEILNLPIMKDKIVDLGTIRYSHEPIGVDYIENYYKWELERKVSNLFLL